MNEGFDKSLIFQTNPVPLPAPPSAAPSLIPSLLPSQIFLQSAQPVVPVPAEPVIRPSVSSALIEFFLQSDSIAEELDSLCATEISFSVNREFAAKWKYIDGQPLASLKSEALPADQDVRLLKEIIDLETKGHLMQIGFQQKPWRVRSDCTRVRVKGVKVERWNFDVKDEIICMKIEKEQGDGDERIADGLRFMTGALDFSKMKLEKKEEWIAKNECVDFDFDNGDEGNEEGKLEIECGKGKEMELREEEVKDKKEDCKEEKEKETKKDVVERKRKVKFMFKKK